VGSVTGWIDHTLGGGSKGGHILVKFTTGEGVGEDKGGVFILIGLEAGVIYVKTKKVNGRNSDYDE